MSNERVSEKAILVACCLTQNGGFGNLSRLFRKWIRNFYWLGFGVRFVRGKTFVERMETDSDFHCTAPWRTFLIRWWGEISCNTCDKYIDERVNTTLLDDWLAIVSQSQPVSTKQSNKWPFNAIYFVLTRDANSEHFWMRFRKNIYDSLDLMYRSSIISSEFLRHTIFVLSWNNFPEPFPSLASVISCFISFHFVLTRFATFFLCLVSHSFEQTRRVFYYCY